MILPEATREHLLALLARVQHHATLFETWGLRRLAPQGPRVAINFYGPPGTGKTMTAEAIAHHLRAALLVVNYAEIESSVVGGTPKNIRAVFAEARERKAVLFFDEADAVLGQRITQVKQSADQGVNTSRSVMLQELERFEGVVLFATNLLGNYDGAFMRRIHGHIEFRLPDEEHRRYLADSFLVPALPREPSVTAEAVAAASEGLSGAELREVVVAAATRAVMRDGVNGYVTLDDLCAAIEAIRAAAKDRARATMDRSTVVGG